MKKINRSGGWQTGGRRNGRRSGQGLLPTGLIIPQLDLRPGDVLLDVGSRWGDLSLSASDEAGLVYALDGDEEAVELLKAQASQLGILNIVPIQADLLSVWPLPDRSVDMVLMADVLPELSGDEIGQMMQEAARVLRPAGRVVILEFRLTEGQAGQPSQMGLQPSQLAAILEGSGLVVEALADVGPDHYLMKAKKT